jgi:hypothetical protein
MNFFGWRKTLERLRDGDEMEPVKKTRDGARLGCFMKSVLVWGVLTYIDLEFANFERVFQPGI